MSQDKLKCLKKYFKKYFAKNFIRTSFSPTMSSIFFIYKPKGGLQLYFNYRQLNIITIKNRYPLFLIKKTLKCICKAKIYSKIDIIAIFNYLQIQ